MRIDRANNGLDPKALSEALAQTQRQAPPASGTAAGVGQDGLVIEPRNARYIQQAGEVDEVNLQAVEEARKLLESGQLDAPEAAGKLAEKILRFGL